jgi:hypothetical protein
VDDAMAGIERDNPALKGVLPKDYARPALDKERLGQLIAGVRSIMGGSAGTALRLDAAAGAPVAAAGGVEIAGRSPRHPPPQALSGELRVQDAERFVASAL